MTDEKVWRPQAETPGVKIPNLRPEDEPRIVEKEGKSYLAIRACLWDPSKAVYDDWRVRSREYRDRKSNQTLSEFKHDFPRKTSAILTDAQRIEYERSGKHFFLSEVINLEAAPLDFDDREYRSMPSAQKKQVYLYMKDEDMKRYLDLGGSIWLRAVLQYRIKNPS